MKHNETFEVYILIAVEPKSKMSKVENKILKLPRVYEVMEILGRYEMMARLKARNKNQLVDIIDKISNIDGVKDYVVLIITKKLKP